MTATETTSNYTILLGLLSIFVALASPVIGYFITSLHKRIDGAERISKERHEATQQGVREVEARCVHRVTETEARAEKGDERVLQQVNSQYAAVQTALREMRDDIKELVRKR